MAGPATLTIAAGDLLKALSFRPRRGASKPVAICLDFNARTKTLTVEEATYGLFSNVLPAAGRWPKGVQIDGGFLRKVASVHPAGTVLELVASADAVVVRAGKFTAQVPRLDATGVAVARKPFPADKKHKGPVPPRPHVRHLTPKGHTWLFSANVVFPPEAYKSQKDD